MNASPEPDGRLVLDLFHPTLERLVEPDGRPLLKDTDLMVWTAWKD
jgi:hypothetical protein